MNLNTVATPGATPVGYRVEDLLVDVGRRRVTRDGTELPVSGLSFDLLMALLRAAPDLVSVDELMQRVWSGLVVGADAVSQRVKVLRRALGDDAEAPRYISGVRGHGYRMASPVVPLSTSMQAEVTEPYAAASPAPAVLIPRSPPTSRRRWGVAAVIASALAVAGFLTRGAWRQPTAVTAAPAGIEKALPAANPGTVAVLPFANLTGDATKDYLGEGMADELINTLTKVPGLKVPARTSSFAYKGRNVDIRQIARDLGVAAILDGSVRTAGDRIRITAQLINAQDGLQIWSESYDRRFADLFKLQDDLASAIVKALEGSLNGASSAPLAPAAPTQDVEAYDLYLQGASLARRATGQSMNRAIELFQQALVRDPRFARAQQGIADARFVSGWIYGQQVYDNVAAAERAARQALALDPNVADSQDVLGGVTAARGQWLEMEAHDRTARSLGGGDGQVHMVRADHLAMVGRLAAALEEARTAYTLAPADPQIVSKLAYVNSVLGYDADARKYAELAVDSGSSRESGEVAQVNARVALRAGHYADAVTADLATLDVTDRDQARTAEIVRQVYAALADPSQRANAIAARRRLYPESNAAEVAATATNVAPCMKSSQTYALLGALDVAYSLANQCLDTIAPAAILGTTHTDTGIWTPELRGFRQDPRFQAFATRLGLMEYWQQYGPPDECDLKDGKLACH